MTFTPGFFSISLAGAAPCPPLLSSRLVTLWRLKEQNDSISSELSGAAAWTTAVNIQRCWSRTPCSQQPRWLDCSLKTQCRDQRVSAGAHKNVHTASYWRYCVPHIPELQTVRITPYTVLYSHGKHRTFIYPMFSFSCTLCFFKFIFGNFILQKYNNENQYLIL